MQPQINLIKDTQDVNTVVHDVRQDAKAVKDGYKTTEFWMQLLAQLAIWSNTPSSSRLQMVQASVSGAVAIAYVAFRTYLKATI